MKRGWRKLILLVEDLQPVGVGEPARAVAVTICAPRAAGPAVASLLLHGIRLLSPQLNLHYINSCYLYGDKYLILENVVAPACRFFFKALAPKKPPTKSAATAMGRRTATTIQPEESAMQSSTLR